jgi:long-chain acyl-CoA synthetase
MSLYEAKNIPLLFQLQADTLKEKACISYRLGSGWKDVSWSSMQKMIFSLAAYLSSKGIKKGDRFAIFSDNRYEWWIADQAILSLGAVSVPIYSTNSAEETLYILKNAGARGCFAGNTDQLEKVLSVKKKCASLKHIISFDNVSTQKHVLNFADIVISAPDKKKIEKIAKGIQSVKSTDLATIIYTSGTTGNPKGVMLTHRNIVSNLKNTLDVFGRYFNENDIFLSFLPISHVLERTGGYYVPICIGAKVAFAENVSKLLDNMFEIRPTVLICVPRIYEKIHAGINIKLKSAPIVQRLIFAFAAKTAAKNLPYVCLQKKRPPLFNIRYKIAHKLVFSKVRIKIGSDRLKYAISGGGPLSISDAEFFMGMGIEILEGFGLTETSPITHLNRPGELKIGSVGRPIPETEVRISDEGEILIKGPQVMKGYYKNPKETKKSMTKDGFFKTGDVGRIDDKGILYITGRSKDIIVTSGGKNISPQNIENKLKGSPYIEQVALIGDRQKFISALIVPDFKEIEKWGKKYGITGYDRSMLCKDSRIIGLFEKEVERLTSMFSRVEKVKKFTLLPDEWTQAGGELTPSQKIKRRVIEEKYSTVIAAIYSENNTIR